MLNDAYEMILDVFYAIMNALIDILAEFIKFVVGLLPEWDLPTYVLDLGAYQIVQTINWIFPVSLFIVMVEMVVASVVLWFTLGIILRWAKVSKA